MVSMVLESIDDSYSVMIGDILVGDFPSNEGSQAPAKKDWSRYEHLRGIEFIDIESKVEMIISSGHAEATTSWERPKRGRRGEPVGRITAFGWTVEGRDGIKSDRNAYVSAISADDGELKESMRLIFERDFPVVPEDEKTLSREAKYALEQLQESVKWDEERGKYSAGLPYKFGREKTAEILRSVDSRATAERRAWSLKRSMERVPEKKEKGFAEMKKFIEKGRARELSREEEKEQDERKGPIWHLPCHLVYQHGKYRFCHDGRAATKGICLNELLIGDLNLMVPITDPINNLRSYIYSFSTDIESFFHNILVDKRDEGLFRFHWYDNEDMGKLVMYIFLAHIFGSSASPTITSYVLRKHSTLLRGIFSDKVCDIIEKYFYVDDGSGGDNTVEGCKKLCDELEEAMKLGGFTLSKWKFSHPELKGDRTVEKEGEVEKKILGVVWNTDTDRLSVAIEDEKFEERAETPDPAEL